jgi:ferritin-like metal-binding protein YciE
VLYGAAAGAGAEQGEVFAYLNGRGEIMPLFASTNLNSFEALFLDQIQDLYDAEKRLVKALPLMAEATSDEALKTAFQQHLRQTENHVARLEQVFQLMGKPAETKTCPAMKGLIKEGDEVIDAIGDPEIKDAGLIAAAQRVEHYEIAGYGTARTFAQHLGREDAAQLLQQTLNEEKATDQKLTELAEMSINRQAVTV